MPARTVLSTAFLALVLTACGGGTKLVKNAPPPTFPETPLAQASDARLSAGIRYLVVRNGPGAWAQNGDWDEYLLRVHNASDAPVTLTAARLTDSLDYAVGNLDDRKALVIGSRKTAKRYRDQGIKVMAGRGGGTLAAIGAGAANAAYGLGSVGMYSSAAAAGALTALVAAPVMVSMGITRAFRNSKVNNRIAERSSDFPMTVEPGGDADLDLFFPISPSPIRLEIVYSDAAGEHALAFDIRETFVGLHLPAATETKPAK